MQEIPEEIIYEIVLRVDNISLNQLSLVSVFWRRLSLRRSLRLYTKKDYKAASIYGYLYDYLLESNIAARPLRSKCLKWACYSRQYKLIDLLCKGKPRPDWNFGLFGACKAGNIILVEKMIALGANMWIRAMRSACKGGQKEIADWMEQMLIKGNERRVEKTRWNSSFYTVCRAGNLEMIEWLLQKGIENLNQGFYGACKGGQIEIVKKLIEIGADDFVTGINIASKENCLEIAEFLRNKNGIH